MKNPAPVMVADRFAPLREQLLQLLAGLSDADWERPTAAPRWNVKDVAAHLLGGDVGILSRKRDGFRMPGIVIESYADLVALVNRLNDEWVVAARRMSPLVMRELLAFTGPQVEAYFSSLDPAAIGEPVNWAGPEPAPVWFDLAREFTERWHHQQQIRDATGRPPLYEPFFLAPVLDTFVRALPYSFREAEAPEGTVVRFEISGDAGGTWLLIRARDGWKLTLESEASPEARLVLPQQMAWRLFTKGVSAEEARAEAVIEGDERWLMPILRTVSVLA